MFNLFKRLAKPSVTVESEAAARLTAVGSVLGANPDLPAALREKGEALFLLSRYCGQARYDEALGCFERLSALDPLDMHALCYRAQIHARTGQPDETERLASRLIEMTPRNGDEWYAKAFALLSLERRDEAAEALRKTLEEEPTHTRALNDMARLEASPAAAITIIDRGLHARPQDPALLYNKACTFLRLDDPKRSVEVLDALLEVAPLDPEAWILKGRAFGVMRDHPGSITCFERALQIAPDHEEAKALLSACRAGS